MNKKIVIYFIILILNSSIFCQDLIITIPEKYSNRELALPPFPEEVINELTEFSYDKSLLITDPVRSLSLSEVLYNYYPEFLNFKIADRSVLTHGLLIEGSSESIKALYSIDKKTNNFFLSVGGGYNSDGNLIDGIFSYSEYRLPFNFNLDGSIEEEMLITSIGNTSYDSVWSLSGGIENSSGVAYGLYKNNYKLRPLISAGYIDSEEYYIEGALGWDFFRVGVSYLSETIYPYIDLSKRFGKSRISGETEADFNSIEYLLYYQFPEGVPIETGGGITLSDNYSSVNPAVYLSESFFFGNRIYNVSAEDLTLEFSFNKDSISSIITFNYPYDSGDWSLGLNLEYEAGE